MSDENEFGRDKFLQSRSIGVDECAEKLNAFEQCTRSKSTSMSRWFRTRKIGKAFAHLSIGFLWFGQELSHKIETKIQEGPHVKDNFLQAMDRFHESMRTVRWAPQERAVEGR